MIWGLLLGDIVGDENPAKRLPISKRLIEFIRNGLFSLMLMRVGNRGCPRSAKKIIRVL